MEEVTIELLVTQTHLQDGAAHLQETLLWYKGTHNLIGSQMYGCTIKNMNIASLF